MLDDHDSMEDLAHHPDGGGWEKWAGGCLLPIAGVIYAVWCLIDKRAVLPGKHGDLVIAGDDAVLFSTAILALAAFLHFHFFWGLHERLWRYSQGCKVLALLVFLPCAGRVIWHQLGMA
ncbi:MAG: hypothetical protein HS117_02510 [Verrucomicrobiaceae bacterium]|nr:hypothetical protein [Verrucomicrobiaceae bacterium]